MPALKRKAPEKTKTGGGTRNGATNNPATHKKPKTAPPPPPDSDDEDDDFDTEDDNGDDDFDDGEDLMATAMKGAEQHEESASDDGNDDSEEADEDGFEDLEAEEEKGKAAASGQDEDGSQAAAAGPAPPSKAQQKRTGTGLYALPTAGEIQSLKETAQLYKNNVLRLQIEEMLPAVRPAYSKSAPLDLVLRHLKLRLDALKPITPQPLPAALKALSKAYPRTKVNVPFTDPQPKLDAPHHFGFEKPTNMTLVGSWPIRTAVKRGDGFDVDVAVTMPSSLFQEKDYLNYRYAHKRAYYLAVLGAALADPASDKGETALGVKVSYQFANGDPRRPILVLESKKEAPEEINFHKLRATIRLFPSHEPTLFPHGRLAPSRNCVRVASGDDLGDQAAKQPATPRYNACVLMDSLAVPHLVFLHSIAASCPAFGDACALLKTWAFKRGFGAGTVRKVAKGGQRRLVYGSSDIRFILTMALAHLLCGDFVSQSAPGASRPARPRLLNSFNAFQLFRGVLDWLGTHDFATKPVRMRESEQLQFCTRSDKIPFEEFQQHFDRVLVDPTGSINLLASFTAGSFETLQAEARRTFGLLGVEDRDDVFDTLFMQDFSAPVLSFDEVAHISIGGAAEADAVKRADHGSPFHATAAALNATVRQALTTRAHRTAVVLNADEPGYANWALDARPSPFSGALELGIVLDAEQATRLVDHGPAPDDAAAATAFREFWGKLAELRRFKDGRIIESVVWEGSGPKSAIPRRIVRHVLQLHHGIQAARIAFVAEAFEGLLEPSSQLPKDAFLPVPVVGANRFQHVQASFDGLVKQLRALEGLPLTLVSVLPAAAALRGTSTFVPQALNLGGLGTSDVPDCASYLPAQNIILVFESSPKWPDDLEALQAMKAAFLETLARLIPANLPGTRTSAVFDDDAATSSIQDQVALDIITPTGYAFRARIQCERERRLLEEIIAEKRYNTPREQRQASLALARYTHRFVTASRHHTAMAAVSHRYPAFGESVRLLKRWISAQMLSDHVPEELLELIAVELFATAGGAAPSSGPAGFAALLKRLGSWRWKEEPITVPLFSVAGAEDEMKLRQNGNGLALAASVAVDRDTAIRFPGEKLILVQSAFTQTRRADPSLETAAWFVCTEEDVESKAWSRSRPFAGAAAGIKKLAAEASARLELGGRVDAVDVLSIFTPSTAQYDFVIHLEPQVLSRYAYSIGASASVWQDANGDCSSRLGSQPRPDFDAGEAFVLQLQQLYQDSFRLFHDGHGGTIIGGSWNPHLRDQSRKYRVALGFSARPVAGNGDQVKLNVPGVLAEIERLGAGLVKRIELLR
ncbi:U3 snoRNP protein [Tilletia horrida]|nr:U3 snoRNP protein [Tilletia horrida]